MIEYITQREALEYYLSIRESYMYPYACQHKLASAMQRNGFGGFGESGRYQVSESNVNEFVAFLKKEHNRKRARESAFNPVVMVSPEYKNRLRGKSIREDGIILHKQRELDIIAALRP